MAYRNGLTPQQLFKWRLKAHQANAALPSIVPAMTVPESIAEFTPT